MKKFFTFLAVAALTTVISFAQVIEKQKLDRNGKPTFVKLDAKAQSFTSTDSKNLLRTVLNMSENDDYKTIRSERDQIGFTHERFQQHYKGIKVEYGVYITHAKNGTIVSLSGEYKVIKDVNITPSISVEDAIKNAVAFVGAKKYMWETDNSYYPKGELVIVKNDYDKHPKENHEMVLAYKLNIYATYPLSRAFIYVDAHTGKVVHRNDIIKHAVASGTLATRYSGSRNSNTDSYNGSYRLRDYSRGNGVETYDMNMGINYNAAVDFVDNDNNWTAAEWNNAAKDNAAFDAQWGAQMTYDYFYQTYNRNSFDNNGAAIKSYVHFDLVEYGYPNNDNAFWDGQRMTYGDGTSLDPLTTLDIAAHEIGHAVCTYTANLTYSYESGALNEAYSDIWAASVEYFAAPEKSTWILGEDLGTTVRSLENPNVANQPDTYQGTYWATGSADNGGVHTNSGVLNHWFYILSVGKSGTNDNNDSYNVTGIGIDKAAAISYRTESQYLTSSSNYADCRTKSIQAAEDLYGAGSDEVIQTTNAFYAIGVGDPYGGSTGSYCTSKGNDFSYEWIAQVQVGGFDKSSGGAAYSDFTSDIINVNAGSNYSITLTPGFASSSYNEYWKIWIDYNDDKDFDDANELVFDAGSLSNSAVNGTISIISSISGDRRMRVSMKYNGAQTSCETFSYGEVEDYTVNIGTGGGDTEAPSAPTGLSASNVTETTLTLSWNASNDNVGVTGYDVYQNNSNIGSVTGTSANVTGLTAATTYSYYVIAKDAAGNQSNESNSINVTTSSGTTSCTNGITSFPYTESFENTLGLWTQATNDNLDWTVDANGTPSSSTGPSSATDGSYYLFVEASGNGTGYPSKTAILSSPCIDLSGETSMSFNFAYHMYGSSMGTLSFEVSTDGNNFTTVWSKTGDQGNTWNNTSVDLSGYAGSIIYVRFFGTTGSSYRSDMAIDNIEITNGGGGNPGCTDVNLTLTFDNYPEETSWTIKDANGTTVASGGTYGSEPDGSTKIETACLSDGCYTFTITDSYGDGICCSYGNGSYSLTDANGTVLASGSSFSSSEATDFCLGNQFMAPVANVKEGLSERISFYPNPVKDELNIELPFKTGTVKIISTAGALMMEETLSNGTNNINVSELDNGIYFLQINSEEGSAFKRFIKQ